MGAGCTKSSEGEDEVEGPKEPPEPRDMRRHYERLHGGQDDESSPSPQSPRGAGTPLTARSRPAPPPRASPSSSPRRASPGGSSRASPVTRRSAQDLDASSRSPQSSRGAGTPSTVGSASQPRVSPSSSPRKASPAGSWRASPVMRRSAADLAVGAGREKIGYESKAVKDFFAKDPRMEHSTLGSIKVKDAERYDPSLRKTNIVRQVPPKKTFKEIEKGPGVWCEQCRHKKDACVCGYDRKDDLFGASRIKMSVRPQSTIGNITTVH